MQAERAVKPLFTRWALNTLHASRRELHVWSSPGRGGLGGSGDLCAGWVFAAFMHGGMAHRIDSGRWLLMASEIAIPSGSASNCSGSTRSLRETTVDKEWTPLSVRLDLDQPTCRTRPRCLAMWHATELFNASHPCGPLLLAAHLGQIHGILGRDTTRGTYGVPEHVLDRRCLKRSLRSNEIHRIHKENQDASSNDPSIIPAVRDCDYSSYLHWVIVPLQPPEFCPYITCVIRQGILRT